MVPSTITLLHEIQEQPERFRAVLQRFQHTFKPQKQPADSALYQPFCLAQTQQLIGLAEGSSFHALSIAQMLLSTWLDLPMQVFLPDELEQILTYAQQADLQPAFLAHQVLTRQATDNPAAWLVVSQSGKTASVLRALEKLQHQKPSPPLRLLTLTNILPDQPPAPLSQQAEKTLSIQAGPEESIAATKTMTLSVLTLLLWGLQEAQHRKTLSSKSIQAHFKKLLAVPEQLEQLFTEPFASQLDTFARKLLEVNHFVLLSKGMLGRVLPEMALKLMETSNNLAVAYNTESFKHGPKVILTGVQGVHPNTLYFVPRDPELAQALFEDIRQHFWSKSSKSQEKSKAQATEPFFESDRVFFVRFKNSAPLPETLLNDLAVPPDYVLTLPAVSSVFEAWFLLLVSFQVICYHLARLKGENPNHPSLNKAVV